MSDNSDCIDGGDLNVSLLEKSDDIQGYTNCDLYTQCDGILCVGNNCDPRDRDNDSEGKLKDNARFTILLLCFLISISTSCVYGVIPEVITDRYARRNHGYTDETPCYLLKKGANVEECDNGNDDGQTASMIESVVENLFAFFLSPIVGAISDNHGRKDVLAVGVIFNLLTVFAFLFVWLFDWMHPLWYYGIKSTFGIVSWFTVLFSALADVVDAKERAPSFGLLMMVYYIALSLGPFLATLVTQLVAVTFSCSSALFATAFCVLGVVPETLSVPPSPPSTTRSAQNGGLLLPNIAVFHRNRFLRTMAAVAAVSGMVYASTETYLVYYLENDVGMDDVDVGWFYLLNGLVSAAVQGLLIRPLLRWVGEDAVVVIAFGGGVVYNLLYERGWKWGIPVAGAIAALTGMAYPTYAGMISSAGGDHEHGLLQGGLASVSSLAKIVGPLLYRFMYHITGVHSAMFFVGSSLYFLGVILIFTLPSRRDNVSPGTTVTE